MNFQYFSTPNGNPVKLAVRPDTNDAALATGLLVEDEYGLRGTRFTGWALDIGAHIGTIGLSLAIDNPALKVVCVEPVPDNAALIRESISANGLTGRVYVEEAGAAGFGTSMLPCHFNYTEAGDNDPGYVDQNRYIGNIWRLDTKAKGQVVEVPAVSIRSLAMKYGVQRFALVKIDCEGCEWQFLAADTEYVSTFVGEYHDAKATDIVDLLVYHDTVILSDNGGIGLFRAVPKPVGGYQ